MQEKAVFYSSTIDGLEGRRLVNMSGLLDPFSHTVSENWMAHLYRAILSHCAMPVQKVSQNTATPRKTKLSTASRIAFPSSPWMAVPLVMAFTPVSRSKREVEIAFETIKFTIKIAVAVEPSVEPGAMIKSKVGPRACGHDCSTLATFSRPFRRGDSAV